MKKGYVAAIVVGVVAIGAIAGYLVSHNGGEEDVNQPKGCIPNRCVPQCKALAAAEQVDNMDKLFMVGSDKFPFMETVRYSKKVSWVKRRTPSVNDYATRYRTSTQMIARSMSGGNEEYVATQPAQGERFNVIAKDKNIEFRLVVDLAHCQMHLYALDQDEAQSFHLKTYSVGVGEYNPYLPSRTATPLGKYVVSSHGQMSQSNGQILALAQNYGTRYLQFGDYAIVGNAFVEKDGQLVEKTDGIGLYSTSGEIVMNKADLEQLYAVVTSRPAVVEVVLDINDAEI